MRRPIMNAFLLALMVFLLAANRGLRSETGRRNFEIFPEMARSAASESYAANTLFADGMAMRKPVVGTVVRGFVPLGYSPGEKEAVRAGLELHNPLKGDPAALARGAAIYVTYCQVCHGAEGLGDGPVSKRGFPTPPSLLAPNALNLPDGRIFHIVTHGQNNMPSHAAQITREDRWKGVLHVRQLQAKAGSQIALPAPQSSPAPSIAASSRHDIDPRQGALPGAAN